ncbi:hypothetical protein Tco_0850018, partial [Tanacetum coccineum]
MDVTSLNLTVSHLNGTMEYVKQIGSYKLGNNLIIKDVLVVPGYHVSLLSVHKMSRDNKVILSFNGSKCKIQDLTQKFLMGTGSEKGGLYFLVEGKRVNNSNIKSCHMLPTTVLFDKSSYECVYKTEPCVLHLKTFGCLCFSIVLNEFDKFGSRADRSNDPKDDRGDSSVNGNKSAPNSSANSPSNITVDEVAKDQVHKQTDNSDIIDLSRSSSNGVS